MSGVNKVLLLGRIKGEPRFKLRDGRPKLAFCLVTSEKLQKQGTDYIHEESHEVVLEGGPAEKGLPVLHDGGSLFIEGSLKTSVYVDEAGVRRYHTYIRAHHFENLQSSSLPAALDLGEAQHLI